jgi:hypothetical protein
MKTEYIPAGISVERQCLDCTADVLCTACVETKESRDSFIAHQIVDEGSQQYEHQMQVEKELPSGHEWIGSTTRVEPYFVYVTQTWEDTRDEFLEPTSLLSDRFFNTDLDKHGFEKVCSTCHLVVNREIGCTACLPEVLQEFVQSQARYYFTKWKASLT